MVPQPLTSTRTICPVPEAAPLARLPGTLPT